MGERAEKGVGEQAGNLDLGESDGRRASLLQQGDALKTETVTATAASVIGRWSRQVCVPSSRNQAASKPALPSSERARSCQVPRSCQTEKSRFSR